MELVPDMNLVSDTNLELYFMKKSGDIKRINDNLNVKGGLCKKSFAIVLGVYHDKQKCESLYRRLNRLKCIQKVGRWFKFLVEEFSLEDDSDIIASDPILSLMDRIVDGQGSIEDLLEVKDEEEAEEGDGSGVDLI